MRLIINKKTTKLYRTWKLCCDFICRKKTITAFHWNLLRSLYSSFIHHEW